MEQAWVWIYKTADGETHDLFMDQGKYYQDKSYTVLPLVSVIKLRYLILGEEIRFRVVKEIFTEAPLPTAPNASRDVDGKPETNNVAPYVLHVNIFMNLLVT